MYEKSVNLELLLGMFLAVPTDVGDSLIWYHFSWYHITLVKSSTDEYVTSVGVSASANCGIG